MTKNNFWVDWADQPYPSIRPASEFFGTRDKFQTLNQCKREIRKHAREQRQHWLTIMHQTDALTESDIYQGKG